MADRTRSRKAPKSPRSKEPEEPTFEEAMQRLESIVDRLEEGDMELETALAEFEQGVKLTRHCASQLEQAQRRIEILVREGEDWVSRPFEASDINESGEPE